MPRLFVGTPHPDDLGTQPVIAALGDGSNVKPVDPKQYHVTLAFIGDVDDEQVDLARQAVQASQGPAPAETAQVVGLGAFPSPTSARVLWAGLQGADLAPLAKRVRGELAARDLPVDERDFHAHLTLARLRRKVNLSALIREKQGVAFGSLPVDALVLYASTLTPRGPEYEVVERVDLEVA